jgi:Ni/Co efflux regulator RcnB
MKKLLSLLVAAVFAVSSGFAIAASHTGAPMKKEEAKKGDSKDAKKAKKSDKKGDKKGAKKDEAKK